MAEKRKVRNLRNEQMLSLLWNVAAIAVVAAAAYAVKPELGPVGNRSMAVLLIFNGAVMTFFMYLLEKYVMTVSGFHEKRVITALSAVYALVIMCIINAVFFTSLGKLAMDVAVTAATVAAVCVSDAAVGRYFENEKRFRKPRLLIIDSESKNYSRMKKVKYGVLRNYDPWYENLDDGVETAGTFIKETFPRYDAICVFDAFSDEVYRMIVSEAMRADKDLFVVPKLMDAGKTSAKITIFDDILTLCMPKKTLSTTELFLKRACDIAVGFIGTLIGAIPMALIAAAIKITSPGPVFYKQTRLTRDKREFEIYKFRTMVPDAEKLSGPKFAEKNDPRITPVGRILRSFRLDELPQFINILKGDMSVVGPRPERPFFIKRFEDEIDGYDTRFEVKAGLTSLSHVYGRYSTYIYDRTYYDIYYITHYSLLLDLKIILLTTKTMFIKAAAEGVDESERKEELKKRSKEGVH